MSKSRPQVILEHIKKGLEDNKGSDIKSINGIFASSTTQFTPKKDFMLVQQIDADLTEITQKPLRSFAEVRLFLLNKKNALKRELRQAWQTKWEQEPLSFLSKHQSRHQIIETIANSYLKRMGGEMSSSTWKFTAEEASKTQPINFSFFNAYFSNNFFDRAWHQCHVLKVFFKSLKTEYQAEASKEFAEGLKSLQQASNYLSLTPIGQQEINDWYIIFKNFLKQLAVLLKYKEIPQIIMQECCFLYADLLLSFPKHEDDILETLKAQSKDIQEKVLSATELLQSEAVPQVIEEKKPASLPKTSDAAVIKPESWVHSILHVIHSELGRNSEQSLDKILSFIKSSPKNFKYLDAHLNDLIESTFKDHSKELPENYFEIMKNEKIEHLKKVFSSQITLQLPKGSKVTEGEAAEEIVDAYLKGNDSIPEVAEKIVNAYLIRMAYLFSQKSNTCVPEIQQAIRKAVGTESDQKSEEQKTTLSQKLEKALASKIAEVKSLNDKITDAHLKPTKLEQKEVESPFSEQKQTQKTDRPKEDELQVSSSICSFLLGTLKEKKNAEKDVVDILQMFQSAQKPKPAADEDFEELQKQVDLQAKNTDLQIDQKTSSVHISDQEKRNQLIKQLRVLPDAFKKQKKFLEKFKEDIQKRPQLLEALWNKEKERRIKLGIPVVDADKDPIKNKIIEKIINAYLLLLAKSLQNIRVDFQNDQGQFVVEEVQGIPATSEFFRAEYHLNCFIRGRNELIILRALFDCDEIISQNLAYLQTSLNDLNRKREIKSLQDVLEKFSVLFNISQHPDNANVREVLQKLYCIYADILLSAPNEAFRNVIFENLNTQSQSIQKSILDAYVECREKALFFVLKPLERNEIEHSLPRFQIIKPEEEKSPVAASPVPGSENQIVLSVPSKDSFFLKTMQSQVEESVTLLPPKAIKQEKIDQEVKWKTYAKYALVGALITGIIVGSIFSAGGPAAAAIIWFMTKSIAGTAIGSGAGATAVQILVDIGASAIAWLGGTAVVGACVKAWHELRRRFGGGGGGGAAAAPVPSGFPSSKRDRYVPNSTHNPYLKEEFSPSSAHSYSYSHKVSVPQTTAQRQASLEGDQQPNRGRSPKLGLISQENEKQTSLIEAQPTLPLRKQGKR